MLISSQLGPLLNIWPYIIISFGTLPWLEQKHFRMLLYIIFCMYIPDFIFYLCVCYDNYYSVVYLTLSSWRIHISLFFSVVFIMPWPFRMQTTMALPQLHLFVICELLSLLRVSHCLLHLYHPTHKSRQQCHQDARRYWELKRMRSL